MLDKFRIDGPACISFSGGRTSGYMLWLILQANDGVLPPDTICCFANTGKEMGETLDFVSEVQNRWNVPIVWLEYAHADNPADRWREVSYATASRNGEPFEACIKRKNFLPNPVTRFCTSELKIKAISRYIRAKLGWDEWTSVIGIRSDEPRRVAKLAIPNRDSDDRIAPLAAAGITAADVGAFWRSQPFDLQLPNINGKTFHGNCDLCFLKGADQLLTLIREKPERAVWWMNMEKLSLSSSAAGGLFRSDRPAYAAMHGMAVQHGELFAFNDEAIEDCACTD